MYIMPRIAEVAIGSTRQQLHDDTTAGIEHSDQNFTKLPLFVRVQSLMVVCTLRKKVTVNSVVVLNTQHSTEQDEKIKTMMKSGIANAEQKRRRDKVVCNRQQQRVRKARTAFWSSNFTTVHFANRNTERYSSRFAPVIKN